MNEAKKVEALLDEIKYAEPMSLENLIYYICKMMKLQNIPTYELNDLAIKYGKDKKELCQIINSGKHKKCHEEKLELFINTINTVKNINNRYLKDKLSVEEYIMELITTLKKAVEE